MNKLAFTSNPPRFIALDSLRGIAALAVFVLHFSALANISAAAKSSFAAKMLTAILPLGDQAVTIFFVLSGFVLTLQIMSPSYSYKSYVIKRICRIYLPYLASIIFAFLAQVYVHGIVLRAPIQAPVNFPAWSQVMSTQNILAHISFILPFDVHGVDPVIWSLVYEMRISLIFPFVYLLIRRIGLIATILGSAVVAYICCASNPLILRACMFQAAWSPTLCFLFLFICGSAIAIKQNTIISIFHETKHQVYIFAIGICLMFFNPEPKPGLTPLGVQYLIFQSITAMATCAIIITCISHNVISRCMQWRPLVTLGRMSYSLYIFHFIIIYLFFESTEKSIFSTIAMPIVFSITFPLSYLLHYYIEVPSIALGQYLANAFQQSYCRKDISQ